MLGACATSCGGEVRRRELWDNGEAPPPSPDRNPVMLRGGAVPSGLWTGVVTRVTATGPMVRIDRLAGPSHEYGPAPVLQGPWTPLTSAAGGTDGHTHQVGTALAPGDRVLVGFREGRPDDIVVLGRLVT